MVTCYRNDRNNVIWDSKGRVRLNKHSTIKAKTNLNKARYHSCIWQVLSMIYERMNNPSKHNRQKMKNRELYYALLDKSQLFGCQNEVDKLILKLIHIYIILYQSYQSYYTTFFCVFIF